MPAPDRASVPTDERLASFHTALSYRFRNPGLLSLALSVLQPPLTPEAAVGRQRLEFLGDAAWNFSVAAAVFQIHPGATAGDLTRLRAAWCSTSGLAQLARQFGMPAPEEATSSAPSDRVMAEMLEAVLGAMVQDGGFEAVQSLGLRVVMQESLATVPPPLDPKSALQLLAQARHLRLPAYRLLDRRGPSHHPTFRVQVTIHDQGTDVQTEAEGSSRQSAEQEAARLALLQLAECSTRQPQHLVANPLSNPQA
jgi:ribonuclease III